MKLFARKSVVGLFDSDQELERAITRLERKGLGGRRGSGELLVLDRSRLAHTHPAVRDDAAASGPLPVSGTDTPEELVGNTFTPFLTRRGAPVSVEEASRQALEDSGLAGGYQWVLLAVPLVLLPYLFGALGVLSGGRKLVFDARGNRIARGRKMCIPFGEVRDLRLQTVQGPCEELRLDAVLHDGHRVTLLEGKASAELSALAGQIAALVGVKLTRIA